MTARPLRHWLMLACLVVIWGSAFLMNKVAVAHLDPGTIVFARLVIAFVVIAPLAFIGKIGARPTGPFLIACALVGVIGNTLPFLLVTWAQEIVPSSMAGILLAMNPLIVIVLAHFFIRGEPLSWQKGAGFLLGFAGTAVLLGVGASTAPQGALLREGAILLAALCYAATTILMRLMPHNHPIVATAWILGFAAIAALPLSGPAPFEEIASAPLSALLAVTALGLLPTGIANIIFFILVREAGATFVSLSPYLMPLWAAMLGATLGGEMLGPHVFLALACILGGMALSEQRRNSLVREGSAE